MTVTEVRPKVFTDRDGAEWRYAVDHLEVRDRDDRFDDKRLELQWRRWTGTDYHDTAKWLIYLHNSEHYQHCLGAAALACANPMTAEEVEHDDELVAQEACD